MAKKFMFASLIAVCLLLGMSMTLRAQRPQEQPAGTDVAAQLAQIRAQLEQVSNNADAANREIVKKLNDVLSDHDKIFKELDIIKVRASLR